MDYDTYISTNPAEKEHEQTLRDFDLWVNRESDLVALAGCLGWDANDILVFVVQYDNNYEEALSPFIEEHYEDLLEYYENNEV